MDIRDVLDYQLPFFREEELRGKIVAKGKLVEIEAGSTILSDGSYVKTIPILLNGLVKVIRSESGKEILLYNIYPLESCIVSINCGINEVKSPISAIAEEDSVALLLPSHQISVWRESYKSLNDFIFNLYQKRFDSVLDAFNALAFQNLDTRLFAYLEMKAKTLQNTEIKMTHQELADEMGSARETVSRILKKLEADGKVELHRNLIHVVADKS